MKTLLALSAILCAAFSALSDTVTATWTAPSNPYIAGYKIYWVTAHNPAGPGPGRLGVIGSGGKGTTLILSNLPPGVIFFEATAYLTNGSESLPSNEASVTNRFIGPTNLHIDVSTNDTVSLWLDNPPINALVQSSKDGQTWTPYTRVESLDVPNRVASAVLLQGYRGTDQALFRLDPQLAATRAPAPLPVGVTLQHGVAIPATIPRE